MDKYKCPRYKQNTCTDLKKKYEIRIEGRWIRLFCGDCCHRIINFKNKNELFEFLRIVKELKDETKEIFTFNYRKDIEKPFEAIWLKWHNRYKT